MRNIEDIIMFVPLIGFNLEVVQSCSKELVGIKGKVVDETKNTLRIETGKKESVVLKKPNIFLVSVGKKKIRIDGEKIMFRPEEKAKNNNIAR